MAKSTRTPEELKEYMRYYLVFMRCKCGSLYVLRPTFILADEDQVGCHVCPACGLNVLEHGEEIPFDDGWSQRGETLLPAGVTRHGKGIDSYYTGLDGYRV